MKFSKCLKLIEYFNFIIFVYCKYGLIDKVFGFFREMKEKGCKFNFIIYRYFILGCLKVGLIKEVLKIIEMGLK